MHLERNRPRLFFVLLVLINLGCGISPYISGSIREDYSVERSKSKENLPSVSLPQSSFSALTSFPTLSETDLLLINSYNESLAYANVETQVNFGPRVPGSNASSECVDWIVDTMSDLSPTLTFSFNITKSGTSIPCVNIITKMNPGHENILIFASHFDSRAVAEKDPSEELQSLPIDGANDGASGVAVMMEMARILAQSEVNWDYEIWFVFFDAEDQGPNRLSGFENWDWCEGSQLMAEEMNDSPELYFSANQSLSTIKSFILFDMVGGPNLSFIHESHSSPELFDQFFHVGLHLGYQDTFPLDAPTSSITDDHVPFAQKGVPTLDLIIKFWDTANGWPYHHTHGDTLEHISAESLKITGKTALFFLYFTFHPSLEFINDNFGPPSWFANNWFNFTIISVGILAIGIFVFRNLRIRPEKFEKKQN